MSDAHLASRISSSKPWPLLTACLFSLATLLSLAALVAVILRDKDDGSPLLLLAFCLFLVTNGFNAFHAIRKAFARS